MLRPLATRDDLGFELRRLGLRGIGVEVGVEAGYFTFALLQGWRQASLFIQVDMWSPGANENYSDVANKRSENHILAMMASCRIGHAVVKRGWAGAVAQCKGGSIDCSHYWGDESLDFIYLDARHDRQSVLADLQAYWPKLKPGGVIAGHDYTGQVDPDASQDPASTGQDWTLGSDGTREHEGRAVQGAVEDFFGGASEASPDELKRCPAQPVITFRDLQFNTWAVVK